MKYVQDSMVFGFVNMIGLWVLMSTIAFFTGEEMTNIEVVLALLWAAVTTHTFIVSIISVAKYQERKGFAITSLCISCFLLSGFVWSMGGL